MKFYGYRRADGSVGCRNLVAVIPSVVCAADVAQAIVQNVQGAVGLFHHQGCSQLPPDLKRVTDTLIGLALNPNVGAVLIVSLGCEGTDHARMYQEIQAAGKPVQAHNLTEDMLADSKPFDVVWDEDIAFLLKDAVLSAYRSERLFPAIKASYEASGRELPLKDVYIRDLKFLASTYMPNLANDSLSSILHRMKIPVDMDNALSRAMACICGLSWLENLYPISSYGIPLSAILAGALQGQPEEVVETREEREAREQKEAKYAKLTYYTKMLFLPFVIFCLFITIYYVHRYGEAEQTKVNFSRYSTSGVPELSDSEKEAQQEKTRLPSSSGRYLMMRGTYVIPDETTIPTFLKASHDRDMETIRSLVRSDKILVFAKPTRIQITGDKDKNGFVPIQILEGDYANRTGFAADDMISK